MRAIYRRLRGLADRRPPGSPALTVVVLAQGPATFLDDCLGSIAGAASATPETMVAADPGEVASAVAAARGECLAFVDADDLVVSNGYEALLAALRESGSDLAVGEGAHRFGRLPAPSWHPRVFDERRLNRTVTDFPGALVDLSLGNKVFRTDFWRRSGLTLGDRYDAWSTTTRAYLAARSFDVVPAPVYLHCARDTGRPLLEQARFAPSVAARRLASLEAAGRMVAEQAPSVHRQWLAGVLEFLVPPMCYDAVGGGDGYFAALRPTVARLLPRNLEVLREVSLPGRLAVWSAAHGTLEELALVLDHLADNPNGLQVDSDGLAALPAECRPLVPEELRRVQAADRRLRVQTGPLRRDPQGGAGVEGAAFVEYQPALPVSIDVLDRTSGARTPLEVRRRLDPRVNEWARRAWEDRSDAGFTALLTPDALAADGGTGRWTLEVRAGTAVETVSVRERDPRPETGVVLDEAVLVRGRLRLSGATGLDGAVPAGEVRAGLVGPRGRTPSVTAARSGDRLDLDLELTTTLFGETVALPSGRYDVDLRDRDGERVSVGWDPAVAESGEDLLTGRLRLTPVSHERGAAVVVGAPLTVGERSPFGQQRLVSGLVAAARRPAAYDRAVLLESFRGRSVGDNPGALCGELLRRSAEEDLDLDLVWVVDDPSLPVPEGTRAVVRRSAAWYDLLSNARGYVSNAGAPYFFQKPPGQFHLQTWHGTPLKRIGEDRGPGDFADWRLRRRILQQAARWDGLVSPSPFCTEIFRRAFRYEGPVLETGYPRNDALVRADAAEVRARVRKRLELTDADRVVLYAPTWREYVGVRDAKPLYLDPEQLTVLLPDTVVLVRGHYNSTHQADVFRRHQRVHDVTRYPDIADLYLAADALVTDYSSVMFDFALTDRPIVLLTPDLDRYRDVERGFYFDIEQDAPGPIVRTTEEVAAVLTGPDGHAASRAGFRRRFCPWDDGAASARVVDRLLSRW